MQTELARETVTVLPKNVRAAVERVPRADRKRGGNTDYHPEMISELAELTLAGWSDQEIANELGVTVRTLHRWAVKHADFAKALEFNDKAAIARVKGSFFAKATGFHFVEEQAIKVKTGEHTEAVEVVQVTRYQPPDTTAGIFYLKNRDRANWSDSQELHVSGSVDLKADVRELALAMLATIKAGLAAPVIEHKEDENGTV